MIWNSERLNTLPKPTKTLSLNLSPGLSDSGALAHYQYCSLKEEHFQMKLLNIGGRQCQEEIGGEFGAFCVTTEILSRSTDPHLPKNCTPRAAIPYLI